ncbi:MAG: metallophosphoesterase family protein [Candidatus Woesearchaeota archaeon]
MKILASGDIHGDIGLVKKLAEKAKKEDVSLVVLCGDITNGEKSIKNLIGPFKEIGKDVLLIPGNHETVSTVDFLANVYQIKNLHGYYFFYNNIGFFGAGGANIGLFQIDEDEMFYLLKKGFEGVKDADKKIMVTHVHPSNSKMENFTKFFKGSSAVRKAIEELKPDILLCSHVHEAEGIEEKIGKTLVINVGKNGKIIDI